MYLENIYNEKLFGKFKLLARSCFIFTLLKCSIVKHQNWKIWNLNFQLSFYKSQYNE